MVGETVDVEFVGGLKVEEGEKGSDGFGRVFRVEVRNVACLVGLLLLLLFPIAITTAAAAAAPLIV
jgi:hypothetical protein